MEVQEQINNISNELNDLYGNEYGEQFINAMEDIKTIESKHIIIDVLDLTLNVDYKQHQIIALRKDIKILKDENKELKLIIKTQNEKIDKLEKDNDLLKKDNKSLNKKVDILMRNHYNLVLWQAYKNVEYYIIQKVTGFDNNMMNNINTNLTEFKNNPSNQIYTTEINKMINKFNIPSYINNIGKLTKNRLNEAHPDPIEMDELELACEDMKKTYNGIEELYNNYQEVYDYFN